MIAAAVVLVEVVPIVKAGITAIKNGKVTADTEAIAATTVVVLV